MEATIVQGLGFWVLGFSAFTAGFKAAADSRSPQFGIPNCGFRV